jgi:hypothetical protein
VSNTERHLTRQQAADFLTESGYKTATSTLAKFASLGGGPVYRCFGRKPFYTAGDLITWAESRCSAPKRSTSDRPQLWVGARHDRRRGARGAKGLPTAE